MAAQRATIQTAATPARSGSSTITAPSSQQAPANPHIRIPPSGTLRLRAEAGPSEGSPQEPERRVQWAEDVVNNEGMGKKSSKVCCIYHKSRPVGESSDEESSDSSSGDDSDAGDDGAARPSKRDQQKPHNHGAGHHDNHCTHNGGKGKAPKRAPNAYEQIPKNG